jgi:hypothetical protein
MLLHAAITQLIFMDIHQAHTSNTDIKQVVGVEQIDTRLFPNQFLIGPEIVSQFHGWKTLHIRQDIIVNHHPRLRAVQLHGVQCSLTLLGYILDPDDRTASDEIILDKLLLSFSSISDLLESTSAYGGRWVIIATQRQQAWMFTDALGLRQAFFTPQHHRGGVWVGSQSGILAECLGFETSKAAIGFTESLNFRVHKEYRWPASSAPFKEIRHLLPNHYLDLCSGQSVRYWPLAPLESISLDTAVDRLAHLLPGLIKAAAMRFNLAFGISAGWDSRLVLAASKEIKDKLEYLTVRQGTMPDTANDIVIPARLLAQLGLKHNVIKALPYMSAEFSYLFKRSVYLAHDHYGGDAEAILAWSQRRKVAMTGSGAEIGRCSFRAQMPDLDRRPITAQDLARLQKMGESPFAIEAFDTWLEDLGDLHGRQLLDLFEWEQGHGNWLAMTQLEFDSAWQDIFTPYNCRDVLETLLSVDECYRKKPDYRLYQLAIERLWPDVMEEPINPGSPLKRKHFISRLTTHLRSRGKLFISRLVSLGRFG